MQGHARFCAHCGIAFTAIEYLPRTTRRQMTILFMDLVSSTDLASNVDADDLVDILNQYRLISASIAASYGGFLARQIGDSVDIYFGYPNADEEDAVNALLAALRLVEEVPRINIGSGLSLAVRIGVATGLVAVSVEQGIAIAGTTPNLAARIQAVTPEGRIGVAPLTRRIAEGPITFLDYGAHHLKGFENSISLSLVDSARLSLPRSAWRAISASHPIIGRQRELQILQGQLQRYRYNRIVATLITGEAGVGKSKLLNEFNARLPKSFAKINLQCSPSHINTPLFPFVQHLSQFADIESSAPSIIKLRKLETFLRATGIQDSHDHALIASLLGIEHDSHYPPIDLSPPNRLEQTYRIILKCLFGVYSHPGETKVTYKTDNQHSLEAQNQLIVTIEDLHWIDPTSENLIHRLLLADNDVPVLLIMTARPEHVTSWPDGSIVSELQLGGLDTDSSRIFINQVANNVVLSDELIALIIKRSDGIPLFIEELTTEVVDELNFGMKPYPRIPITIHDLLRARIDRLPPSAMIAVQLASVIGREFNKQLMLIVSDELKLTVGNQVLHDLCESGLVLQDSAHTNTYQFKHALIVDTAYASISPKRRATYHQAVGSTLVKYFQDDANEQPQVIASHFTCAGNPILASPWWQASALQSLERGAPLEAAKHLKCGIECLDIFSPHKVQETEFRECQLKILTLLGPTMMILHGPGSSVFGEVQERAYNLALNHRDKLNLFPISYAWCLYKWARSSLAEANRLALELLQYAERDKASNEVIMASNLMAGIIAFHRGNVVDARSHLLCVVNLYDPINDAALYSTYLMNFGVFGRFYLALCNEILGQSDLAVIFSLEAVDMAPKNDQPHSLGFSMLACFIIALLQNNIAEVKNVATRCLAFSSQHCFPEFIAMAHVALGWVKAQSSATIEEGVAEMNQGLNQWSETGFINWQPWFAVLIAEAKTRLGKFVEAKAIAEDYMQQIKMNGENIFEPILRAEIAAAMVGLNYPAKLIEAQFSAAIEKANAFEMRAWRDRIMHRIQEIKFNN